MIVVSAATGQYGRLVIEHLLQRVPATEVAVVVRNPSSAADRLLHHAGERAVLQSGLPATVLRQGRLRSASGSPPPPPSG